MNTTITLFFFFIGVLLALGASIVIERFRRSEPLDTTLLHTDEDYQ